MNSLPALRTALGGAVAGDRIVLADGVYTADGAVEITNQGTARRPIMIAAQHVGGVEIRGVGDFVIRKPSTHVTIEGFKFLQEGAVIIAPGASHCRISRNVFQEKDTRKAAYLQVSGDDAEIDYNTFQNKNTVGQMLSIQGPGTAAMAQRAWIHHNYFHHFVPTANDCSAIQIGLSGRSMSSAFALVEYNLFVQTAGENEGCVCNKSCDNTYRFNTFGEGSRELSLRHGNRCQVYGNFFIGSEGIRFFGREHRIYDNYFERCRPALNIGNGDAVIPPGGLRSHDRPDGVQVTFNTFVSNRVNVVMGNRPRGLGAANFVFADNIIEGGGVAVSIEGQISNAVWQANMLWANNGGPGNIPVSGFVIADPMLGKGSASRFRLQPGSPAIGHAAGHYAYASTDIKGCARGDNPDIGADQYSRKKRGDNPILTPADVGPQAEAHRGWLALFAGR